MLDVSSNVIYFFELFATHSFTNTRCYTRRKTVWKIGKSYWAISANVNNYFELFATHSFINFTFTGCGWLRNTLSRTGVSSGKRRFESPFVKLESPTTYRWSRLLFAMLCHISLSFLGEKTNKSNHDIYGKEYKYYFLNFPCICYKEFLNSRIFLSPKNSSIVWKFSSQLEPQFRGHPRSKLALGQIKHEITTFFWIFRVQTFYVQWNLWIVNDK